MSKNNKFKMLFSDLIIFAIGSIGSKAIMFLLVPLYTHYLLPEEYGVSDLIFTISQLAIPFFSIVIFDAVLRFGLYRKDRPQDVLLVGMIVWVIGSFVCLFCLNLFSLYKTISEWKWHIIIYISASILLDIELNYLRVVNKKKMYAFMCILQTFLMASLNILFVAHLKLGIEGYVLSYVISCVIIAVLIFVVANLYKELKNAVFDLSLAKDMVKYSAPLILNNISWWVIQSSDKFILEILVGKAALGVYVVASKIPSLLSVFITVFQQAWGISSITEMDSSNDKNFYMQVFKMYSFLVFLVAIFLCIFIRPFMYIYITSKAYEKSSQFAPLLITGAVFYALSGYCGSMYGALKLSVNNMVTTLIAAITNLLISCIAIIYIGVWGAVIGTVISYMLLAFIRMINIDKLLNLSFDWRKIVTNSVLVLLEAIVVSFLKYKFIFIISVFVIILFVIINLEEIKTMLKRG